MDEQERRAHDIAAQIALAELLRVVVARVAFHKDPETFRQNMQVIEKAAVGGLMRRQLWAEADEVTEAYVKEAASAYVTRLLASIRHPSQA